MAAGTFLSLRHSLALKPAAEAAARCARGVAAPALVRELDVARLAELAAAVVVRVDLAVCAVGAVAAGPDGEEVAAVAGSAALFILIFLV